MSSCHGVIEEQNQRSYECGRELREAVFRTINVLSRVTGAIKERKLHVLLVRQVDDVPHSVVIDGEIHRPRECD